MENPLKLHLYGIYWDNVGWTILYIFQPWYPDMGYCRYGSIYAPFIWDIVGLSQSFPIFHIPSEPKNLHIFHGGFFPCFTNYRSVWTGCLWQAHSDLNQRTTGICYEILWGYGEIPTIYLWYWIDSTGVPPRILICAWRFSKNCFALPLRFHKNTEASL